MTWQQYQPIEEIEVSPPKIDRKLKMYWDNDTQTWVKAFICSVPRRMEDEYWLKENYANLENVGFGGWWATFNRLVMNEKIYTHFALCNEK